MYFFKIIFIVVERILFLIYTFIAFFYYLCCFKRKVNINNKNILIVHGWGTRSIILYILKKRLINKGYNVFVPEFGWHFNSIEELVNDLDNYIKENKLKESIFIGHSLGGLIGYYYNIKTRNTFQKFISLGTPFHGTMVAKLAFFSDSAKEILPNSIFIKKIQSEKKLYKKYYSIFTKHDELVPYQSSEMKNMHNIKMNTVGHLNLIFSKKVFKEIDKVLSLD